MKTAILVVATLIVQGALQWPGMPAWGGAVLLPMVWIVGPALERFDRRWTFLAVLLGLAWDLLLEPVIGPGGIAWSAAALALGGLATIIADRSAKAWFVFGVVGSAVVALVQRLALLPFGLAEPATWTELTLKLLATGVWCGLVGWIRAYDMASRWAAWRARKLR